MDTIKALSGDLIHKNTELLEEREQHAITKSQLDIANAKIKKLRSGNYKDSMQELNPPM